MDERARSAVVTALAGAAAVAISALVIFGITHEEESVCWEEGSVNDSVVVCAQ